MTINELLKISVFILGILVFIIILARLCFVIPKIGKICVITGNHKPKVLFARGSFYNPLFSRVDVINVTDISDVLLTKLNQDEELSNEEVCALMLLTDKVARSKK